MNRDPRFDAYIERAQPFARPILKKVRERVHAIVPDIDETIKWGHPTYVRAGKILLGTAAFKAHASVHFWRGQELGFETKDGAMGELGKLTSVDDLPDNLDGIIEKAARISGSEPPRKPKRPQKPLPPIHPDFASALDKAPIAKANFEGLATSHRREYLEWISEAKQDVTRKKRIETAIEWIGEGKRRNWKYENC